MLIKENCFKVLNILIFGMFFVLFFQNFIYFKELSLIFDGGHQWLTADWLINYNFGFIRRGMFGSFFINLPFEYQNIIFLIKSVLFVIYLLTLLIVFSIYYENLETSVLTLYLTSPLFFNFIFVNKDASFRKEMLCIFTIALLLIYQKTQYKAFYFLTFLFYILSIFSSEYGFMLFIPICYLFFNTNNNFKIKDIIFVSIPPFSYLIFHFLNSKLYESRSTLICEYIKNLNPFNYSNYICEGQINWIGYSLSETIKTTTQYYDFNYILYFFVAFLIGLVPIVVSGWFKNNLKFLLLQILMVLIFFILATDWGRTLYLFFSINYLIAMRSINNQNETYKLSSILVILVFLFIQIDYWKPQNFSYLSFETVTSYQNGILNFKNNLLIVFNEIIAFI